MTKTALVLQYQVLCFIFLFKLLRPTPLLPSAYVCLSKHLHHFPDPILELRASIPLGYLTFNLSIWEATLVSILGGVAAAAITLALLPPVTQFFLNFTIFKPLINWVLHKTRAKHSDRFATLGKILLVTLVAIPLPGSGAYAGSLVAYLFGVPYKSALKLITIGIVISGVLVALITLGGQSLWNLIF